MFKSGKTKIAIISLAAITIFAVTIFAVFVAAGTHTADVTLEPEPAVFACNDVVEFTVTVEHTSGDAIREVRIFDDVFDGFFDMIPPNIDFECGGAPSGWNLVDQTATNDYCQYQTSTDRINLSSEVFTFTANLTTESNYKWGVETRDTENSFLRHELPVTVDCTAPTTTKHFDGPQSFVEGEYGTIEWIDGVTEVVLDAVDDEVHNSGVKETFWRNTIVPDEYCWEPEEYCAPCEVTNGNGGCGEFTRYTGPFTKGEQSCHLLEFFSEDEVGNVENTNLNCFFVDKTPPEIEKEIGTPKVTTNSNIEQLGDGVAAWTTSQFSTGSFSARLFIPDDATSKDFAGVDSFFDVFVQLDTITSLSYDRKVVQFDKGWSPLIVLGIDANGDGIFEAQPLEWEASLAGTPDPNLLGDDSFIQCEAPTPLGSVDGAFTNVDAYNTFNCYTPNSAGDGYESVYKPLSFFQANNVGRIETDDDVAMVKVMLGGNPATQDNEIAYVDNVKLNTVVIIDEDLGFTWVTQNTEIWLSCKDVGDHPSNDVTIHWEITVDTEGDGFDDNTPKKFSENDDEAHFTFAENSLHQLEYWCTDAVDKESNHFFEIDKVDSEPPIITKEMFGVDHLGDCPPTKQGDECFVADNDENGVDIWVEDPNPIHAVNDVQCSFEVVWDTDEKTCKEHQGRFTEGKCIIDENEFEDHQRIIFHEDSTHTLIVECEDALGNRVVDEEVFIVDSTPPKTTKMYGDPSVLQKEFCEPEYQECFLQDYITSSTPIELWSEDKKVGTENVFWRINVVPDKYCLEPEKYCAVCDATSPNCGDFNKFEGEHVKFFIKDQSCHVIEFFGVDKLGNEETLNFQCVFVDNTPPEGKKVVGEPNVLIDPECNPETETCDFFITQQTQIDLICVDPEPHPVDRSTLFWRDYLEGTTPPEFTEEESGSAEIFKNEDSRHVLEFFCEDALGNANEIEREILIVDTQPPIINKTMNGPWHGQCPPRPNTEDVCFIDGITEIHVDATDPEPHPVGDVLCDWSYKVVDGEGSGGDTDVQVPFIINFPEESEHELTITCRDALGNKEVDVETFFVDKTPPVTTKEYGEPFFEDGDVEWITSNTDIVLEATDNVGDHDSGISVTKYRVTLVDDDAPLSSEACERAVGSGDFLEYEGPFTINEDSAHLIEFFSVDNVNKTEEVKRQCVFVDNSPPTPIKEVGVPKDLWTPGENGDPLSVFFPEANTQCWNNEENELECWEVTLDTPGLKTHHPSSDSHNSPKGSYTQTDSISSLIGSKTSEILSFNNTNGVEIRFHFLLIIILKSSPSTLNFSISSGPLFPRASSQKNSSSCSEDSRNTKFSIVPSKTQNPDVAL